MSALAPLPCPSCDAPVPLPATDVAAVPCAHCATVVAVPADYRAGLAAAAKTAAARAAAEPIWQTLAQPASPRVGNSGLALVLILPVIGTLLASLLPYPPWPRGEIYALVTLPALAPGALIYLWSRAVDATVLRFRDALGAHPPAPGGSAPSCRICGAPLAVPADAIAVTCGYCGSDSLLEQVPVRALQRKLRAAMRTLDDAAHKLRLRKVALGFGAVGLLSVVGGAAVLMWIAIA